MYQLSLKILLTTLFSMYIFLLYILSAELYLLDLAGTVGEIFPAFDMMIIYYFSSYKTIRYWILFLIGIILDQIYGLPLGTSSLAYILANLILNYASRWFILQKYLTNILVFCAYSLFIICFRYLVFTISYQYSFEGLSIYFYYLTTILSYPILNFLIYQPSRILVNYAR